MILSILTCVGFSSSSLCLKKAYPFSMQNPVSHNNCCRQIQSVHCHMQSINRSSCCLWGCKMEGSREVRSSINGVGNMANNHSDIFPRINVRDPYKRLGISREASFEEIEAARNFFINKYGHHKPSHRAIESAHSKIIKQFFYERRRPRFDLKRKVKESHVLKAIISHFETPSITLVITTAITFTVLGALTVLYPTEDGPTLQVAFSLVLTLYCIYYRLRNKVKALLYGVTSFCTSWLLGTVLVVSVIPPLIKGSRSLEVTTSLASYALLWISSTYLK